MKLVALLMAAVGLAVAIPSEGELRVFDVPTVSPRLDLTMRVSRAKYTVNRAPDSLFSTNFKPGSVIYDQRAGIRKIVLSNGKEAIDEHFSTVSRELPGRWLFVICIATILYILIGSAVTQLKPRQ